MSDHETSTALPGLGLRKVVENSEDMAAIGKLLKAMEGMQEQVMTLTEFVIDHAVRIEQLEKKNKPKLISVRS
jgi:hypothetical protein